MSSRNNTRSWGRDANYAVPSLSSAPRLRAADRSADLDADFLCLCYLIRMHEESFIPAGRQRESAYTAYRNLASVIRLYWTRSTGIRTFEVPCR